MNIRKILLGMMMFLVIVSFGVSTVTVTFAAHLPGGPAVHENNTNSPSNQIRTFSGLVSFAMDTINQIIILIIALGVVWTIYLAFAMIKAEGDKKAEARNSIIYGLVGIFVMVSIWGLVNIFKNTFNLDNDTKPRVPTLSV